MNPFTGAPAEPAAFIGKLGSPEAINAYYQKTLGPVLSQDLSVTQFTRMILAELYHNDTQSFESHKTKVFVPGIPENVALLSLVMLMRQDRHIGFDLLRTFKESPEIIAAHRAGAMALAHHHMLEPDDFSLKGYFLVEIIGLMDTVRRTLNQLKVTQALFAPPDTVDKALGYLVYDHIKNLLPLVTANKGAQ